MSRSFSALVAVLLLGIFTCGLPAHASTSSESLVQGDFHAKWLSGDTTRMQLSWSGKIDRNCTISEVRLGYYHELHKSDGPTGEMAKDIEYTWTAEIPRPQSYCKMKVEFDVVDGDAIRTYQITRPFRVVESGIETMDRGEFIRLTSAPDQMLLDPVSSFSEDASNIGERSDFSFSIGKVTYDRLSMDPLSERRLSRAFIDVRTKAEGSSSWIVREQDDLEDDGSYQSGTWSVTLPFTLRIEFRTKSDRSEHVMVAQESGQTYAAAIELQITSSVHHIIPAINIPESIGTTWEAFAIFGALQDAWQWMDDEANEGIGSVDVVYPSSDTNGYDGWYECATREIHLREHGANWSTRGILHHEYGHHIQCREYGYIAGCSVPYVEDACGLGENSADSHWASMPSCPEFAWAEGYAEFMECAVDGMPTYLGDICSPTGNIDDNTWYQTDGETDDGCITEGSIAAILWDAADGDSESNDRISLGYGDLVNDVVLGEQPISAAELAVALIDETNDYDAVRDLYSKYGCDLCDIMPLIAAPQLSQPVDGATGQPVDLTLSWNSVSDAVEYAVQLGFNCGEGTIRTTTNTQILYSDLTSNTYHEWRVRTKNECGEWGPWSLCRSFTTVSDVPACRVSPLTLEFDVGQENMSDTKSIFIYNDGGGILQGEPSSDSAEVSIVPASYSVAGGSYVELLATYTPTDCGNDEFTIDAGTNCTQDVVCSAIGPSTPFCNLSTAAIQLQSDLIGQTASGQFQITNDGCGTLSGVVTTDCSTEIVVSPVTYDIGPGSTAVFQVDYTPTDNGTDTCTITTGCGTLDVTAIGPDPICEVSVESVGIQVDIIGGQGSSSFFITNTGTGMLEGLIGGVAGTEVIVSPKLYSIGAGQSQEFTVVYIPTDCGKDTLFIETGTDCTGEILFIGLGPSQPVCELSSTELVLDSSADGLPSTASVWVSNTNCGILSGTVVWDCPEFTVDPVTYDIGAGQSQEFTVTYAPIDSGTDPCLITFGECGVVQATGIGQGVSDCTVEPSSLQFVSPVGTPVSLPVTVTNTGETQLSGSFVMCDPTLTADDPSYDLEPSEQKVVTITFTPVDVGVVDCEIDTGLPCGNVSVQAEGVLSYCATDIDDLQDYGPDCDPSANPCINEQVLLEGVVYVAKNYSIGGHYMQGASGGINFYDPDAIPLVPGDRIRIVGPAWYDSNNEIYVGWPAITVLGHEAVPVPIQVTTGALQDCELIGSYVETQGVVMETGVNANGEDYYLLDDGSGPVMVYIDPDTGAEMTEVQIGETWLVRSPAMNFSGEIRVSPITAAHHFPLVGPFSDIASGDAADISSGSGVAWMDYDADGDPDLFLARDGAPNLLLRNDGGNYTQVPSYPLDASDANTASTWADVDNDGFLDAYLLNADGANMLAEGAGSGFSDATVPPLDDTGEAWGSSWADMDQDGLVDLVVSNAGGQNLLLRNNGVGFDDITPAYFGDITESQGVFWRDFDLDGDADLLVLAESGTSVLLRNSGNGVFDTNPILFPTLSGAQGAAWGDFNGDGYPDLYVTRWGQPNRLYENLEGVDLQQVSMPAVEDDGWGQSAAWADYDLDGDLDLYLANYNAERPNKLFRNDGGTMVDAELTLLADAGPSVGAAWADHDLDGDPDLYVVNAQTANRLFLNNQASGNHWLQVRLTGMSGQSNMAAIGARVEVKTASRHQIREITAQEGYLSQGDLVLGFGLGTDSVVEFVRVIWPRKYANGQHVIQVENGIAVDQRHDFMEPFTTAIEPIDGTVPTTFRLHGAVPNPFNPMTTIRFEIPSEQLVDLEVYDLAGRRIRSLVDHEKLTVGTHERIWNGTRDDGSLVPTGVYVCRMRAGASFQQAMRMVLLK